MPLAPEKLSIQPAAQVGTEADYGMVVQDGQTRRQTRTQLRTAILSAWQGFVGTFLAAANTAAARSAIGAAGSGANTDITSLNLSTALPVAQGGTGSATAATARAALGVLNVGPDYINGLQGVWNSANSISITGGSAYIPSTGTVLNAAATITKSGLTLTAATWYHVYLYSNAGVADVEIVTTAPSAKYSGTSRTKTGDTSRRYLFSILTGAANTIIRFKNTGNKISYLADHLVAPLAIATNLLSTTSAAVSAAGALPATATHASMFMWNATGNAGVAVLINDADMGAVSTTNSTLSLGVGSICTVDLSVSAALTFNYMFTATPGANGLYARVYGYLFER